MSLRKEISEIKLLIEGMLSTDSIPTPFIDLLIVKVDELKKELIAEKNRMGKNAQSTLNIAIETPKEDIEEAPVIPEIVLNTTIKPDTNPFKSEDNKDVAKLELETIDDSEQKERIAEVLQFTDSIDLDEELNLEESTLKEDDEIKEGIKEDTTEETTAEKIKVNTIAEENTPKPEIPTKDSWEPIRIEETLQLIYGPHPPAFAKEKIKEKEDKSVNQNISDKYRTNRKVSDLVLGKERLGEQMEQKPVSDLRRAIPLIDRFRFQRELFKNDGDLYRSTINSLNNLSCYEEAEAFLIGKISLKSDSAEEFLTIVKRRWV